MYRRILVPLDGSELAETVLPHVRALAKCTGAEIGLLRVAVYPLKMYFSVDSKVLTSILQDLEAEVAGYLDKVAAGLLEDGLVVTTHVGRGEIAETMLDRAERWNADLIVISTHGCGGLGRLLMGSIADQIVCTSKVPLLPIPPAQTKSPGADAMSERTREPVAAGSQDIEH